ncbi:MAG: VOC family protein [Acidimicrobiales bacterium]
MIQEANGPGRRLRTASLQCPFGRGINLEIEVDGVDAVHERMTVAGHEVIVPIEERWYGTAEGTTGHRQFVVADPDGYFLRFYTDLRRR